MRRVRNWTIPPVLGKTPEDTCVDLGWESFPCVRGNLKDIPRGARRVDCNPIIDHEIASSRVIHVEGRTVVTKGGAYILDGEPRPSFIMHCKTMGVDPNSPTAVAELFSALR